ncbi:hypothetical protein Sta7437_2826 [Stanieria cyanosphaera PCC 7437]|uniref:Uncharacterized protein n=1 Tax=Stanieria cyanosphaera (strain ATCC 29371 / PCC 7437) TaxID=111780 RepID=K9XXF3_STAC7|nr:hypothetical protein [Stanieria cyanosphaera]AFZ36347.1 hypothetical protein Sta7437_2826 [Stanieria cyanosphaera PCC 7437]
MDSDRDARSELLATRLAPGRDRILRDNFLLERRIFNYILEGLSAEFISAVYKPRPLLANQPTTAAIIIKAICLPSGSSVAHGGNPQDRTDSPVF